MPSEAPRVYADTSVFGGPFDPEFAKPSRLFFEQVRGGTLLLVTSALVRAEIAPAPREVRALFDEVVAGAELIEVTPDADDLQQAYLAAKIVSPASEDDALHVALASVARCPVIVSWNFQHIVNFRRIPLYNAVNTHKGYDEIRIHSPSEVVDYGS